MSEFPFQKFINLVSFDQVVNALERDVLRLEKELHDFEREIVNIDDKISHEKIIVTDAKKNVDMQELEMKTLDTKLKEKQSLLDKITNQREYQSAYQEIERLKKNQFEHEDSLLAAWNTLEAVTRKYLDSKQELEKRRIELDSLMHNTKQQKELLQQKLKEQREQRAEKEAGIPQEWLERYAVMRRSVTNPVVPVVNNACSACFYSITQQDVARLRRNALLQCKECYRFLYMES